MVILVVVCYSHLCQCAAGRPALCVLCCGGAQDKGAYALAEALKANGEAAVTTLNLSSNYITKYGQVHLKVRDSTLVYFSS